MHKSRYYLQAIPLASCMNVRRLLNYPVRIPKCMIVVWIKNQHTSHRDTGCLVDRKSLTSLSMYYRCLCVWVFLVTIMICRPSGEEIGVVNSGCNNNIMIITCVSVLTRNNLRAKQHCFTMNVGIHILAQSFRHCNRDEICLDVMLRIASIEPPRS